MSVNNLNVSLQALLFYYYNIHPTGYNFFGFRILFIFDYTNYEHIDFQYTNKVIIVSISF